MATLGSVAQNGAQPLPAPAIGSFLPLPPGGGGGLVFLVQS